jgi:hypothetical protein
MTGTIVSWAASFGLVAMAIPARRWRERSQILRWSAIAPGSFLK